MLRLRCLLRYVDDAISMLLSVTLIADISLRGSATLIDCRHALLRHARCRYDDI